MTSSADARWVFWDLDGTLLDSMPALFETYRDFLKGFGCRGSRAEFNRLIGPNLREIVSHLKKTHRLKPAEEKLAAIYQKRMHEAYIKKAILSEGAVKALSVFKKNGLRQMLVTSAVKALAKPCLQQNRIASYFDLTVFGDEVKRSKPHPEIYRKALRKADIAADRAIVIEDSRNGVLSARLAGLKAIRVQGGGLKDVPAEVLAWDASQPNHWPLNAKTILNVKAKTTTRKAGQLFCIANIHRDVKKLRIAGRFVPYASYRRSPKRYEALAVSGLVTARKNGQTHYLVGKRSNRVFSFKNAWELVPSGGVDGSCVRPDGRADLKRMLLSELREEAGIGASSIRAAKPCLLTLEPKSRVWDVCLHLRAAAGLLSRKLSFNKKEYSSMDFYSESKARRLFAGKKENVVPVSRHLWEFYQHNKGAL